MKKTIYKANLNLIGLVLLMSITGCEKSIQVSSPISELVGKEVYESNATAVTVLAGIYMDMAREGSVFTGRNSISALSGVSADELTSIADPNDLMHSFYTNSLTTSDNGLWASFYSFVFRINSAIEGISGSTGITSPVKQRLLGELKFLRAFIYFYLVNLYGDVPLLLSTDIKQNSTAPRVKVNQVYEQIIKDLEEARIDLNEDYLSGDLTSTSIERVRPNRAVATAMLARVYLFSGYLGDESAWAKAESAADVLISNTSVYSLESLENAFLSTSKEAIWQLQPVGTIYKNVPDGQLFVLSSGANGNPPSGPNAFSRPVYLSKQLFNQFKPGDKRKISWVDSVEVGGIVYPFPFKYKKFMSSDFRSEYLMVFRLAEQHLIRAEARAKQGKLLGANSAESDLNIIRNRAGLAPTSAMSQTDMLAAIQEERRLELFTEWGHRWLDLKRTGSVNDVMTVEVPLKGEGGTWETFKALYPIPILDIQRNPSLRGKQNPGYPQT